MAKPPQRHLIDRSLGNNAVGLPMSVNLESFNYLSRLKAVTQTLFKGNQEAANRKRDLGRKRTVTRVEVKREI